MNKIFEEVVSILGSDVYLVGGAVRDSLLDRVGNDHDFATPLLPDEIEKRVREAGKRPFLIGKRFGTVGFKVSGDMVEVTTFRSDSYTAGSRQPEVTFSKKIEDDLARRDFTINAMAMDVNGKLIDPFSGQFDIERKLIRAVGKPKARFKEDPLRLLRAARFSSQLEFTIEDATFAAIQDSAHSILSVSKERWMQEMDKLIMGKPEYLINLWRSGLMNFMFPEIALQWGYDQKSDWHQHQLWLHTVKVMEGVHTVNERWAAFFHDAGKPFTAQIKKDGVHMSYIKHELVSAEIWLRHAAYLKVSNERKNEVYDLVLNHMSSSSPLRQADIAAH